MESSADDLGAHPECAVLRAAVDLGDGAGVERIAGGAIGAFPQDRQELPLGEGRPGDRAQRSTNLGLHDVAIDEHEGGGALARHRGEQSV